MSNIPYHEHTFVIPTATTEEIAAGIISDKAVTPDQLLPVLDAIVLSGDMSSAVYDPNGIAADAFDMDNMIEGATNLILTAAERALIAGAVQSGDALVPGDIGSTVQAWDAQLDSLSSASANGVSLVTAADYAAMRTLLGLGTAALKDTGTSGTTVPLLDGVNTWSGVQSYQSAIWQGGISSTARGTNASGFASSTAGGSVVLENTSASGSGGGGGFIAYCNDGAAMASGDRLGLNLFGGSSSASAIRNTAGIAAYSSQAWVDGSAYGTRLEFQTTANSGTSRTTKLILGNGGILTFGATEANTVPALKPSSAVLQARLGDDSDYAVVSVKSLTVSDAATTRSNLGLAYGTNVREKLTADRDYYVRSDGNNANAGTANTSGGAWATKQYAVDYVLDKLDLNGFNCTINVGASADTTGSVIVLGKVPVGGIPKLKGDTTTPSNVPITVTGGQCIDIRRGTKLYIEGFKISTVTSGNGLHVSSQSYLGITGNMEYGACAGYHMTADHESCIGITANYSITGGAVSHWNANNNSDIEIVQGPPAITVTGTPTFTQFYSYDRGGVIECDATFTGSITGGQGSQGATGAIRSSTTIPGSGVTYGDRTAGNVTIPTDGKQVVVGAAAAQTFAGITPSMQMSGLSSSAASIGAFRWTNDTANPRFILGKSRGTSPGTFTVVQSGDLLGEVMFGGADGSQFRQAASIRCYSDATPGSADMPGRLEFLVSVDGGASPAAALVLNNDKAVHFPSIGTTASAANAFLDSAATNNLLRSTSSLRYKENVEPLDHSLADKFISEIEPIWYHSLASADVLDDGRRKSFYSFGAETVARIDPRLVDWGYHDDDYSFEVTEDAEGVSTEHRVLKPDAEKSPIGINDRAIIAMLVDVVKRQDARIAALEARGV